MNRNDNIKESLSSFFPYQDHLVIYSRISLLFHLIYIRNNIRQSRTLENL